MKYGLAVLRNFYFYLLPDCFRVRPMWLRNTLQSSLNAINSLSRFRKFVIVILILLGFLYYLGPTLFRTGRSHLKYRCLEEKLKDFDKGVKNFDVIVNKKESEEVGKFYPPYVGNGNVAASFASKNGLFIRLHRALSLPLNVYPIVQTRVPGENLHEATSLDFRSGLAYRHQAFRKSWVCFNFGSQIYAHRSRPSVLVQDIRIKNPSTHPLTVEFDRAGFSNWIDSETKHFSDKNHLGEKIEYQISSGIVPVQGSDSVVAVAVGMVTLDALSITVKPNSSTKLHMLTVIHYTKPIPKPDAKQFFTELTMKVQLDMQTVLKISDKDLRSEHIAVWGELWQSGFSISESKATGALNGDKINSTLYYILSNVHAPLHELTTSPQLRFEIQRVLHYPDHCYAGHSTLQAEALWADVQNEDEIARVVTTWMITLEKQGCAIMVQSGAEGVLQAFILSLGAFHFLKDHLEMAVEPKDLHRDLLFRRINYGNNTHLNVSVVVGSDNKANIFISLDRNDRPYYACDAGCLDPPVPLDNTWKQFPVKKTEPLTSILYITADKQHMQELKHAIHVKAIEEAPPHEQHVLALHKHGHHFGGLPMLFWISIAFLITIFHLFLFKLIYNEYCQGQERYQRTRYNL